MELSRWIAFIGGKPKPSRGLSIILWDAVTVGVREPKVMLGDRQTLIRCFTKPPDRLGVIPSHAPTSGVQLPQVELGKRVSLVGKRTQYLERDRIVGLTQGGSSIIERT
jgi:hypothetical protein